MVGCTVVSLLLANSSLGASYAKFWHLPFAGHALDHWVNDGLMAIFFLLVGLELKREILAGELSDPRNASGPRSARA